MEYTAIQKNISTPPRKLRLVADMVRKMTPEAALGVLKFTNKQAALPLAKAIKTAIANAGKKENLQFVKLEINKGIDLKRFRAGSKGRTYPYKRKLSHIKIVLTDELRVKSKELIVKDKEKTERKKEQSGTKN